MKQYIIAIITAIFLLMNDWNEILKDLKTIDVKPTVIIIFACILLLLLKIYKPKHKTQKKKEVINDMNIQQHQQVIVKKPRPKITKRKKALN